MTISRRGEQNLVRLSGWPLRAQIIIRRGPGPRGGRSRVGTVERAVPPDRSAGGDGGYPRRRRILERRGGPSLVHDDGHRGRGRGRSVRSGREVAGVSSTVTLIARSLEPRGDLLIRPYEASWSGCARCSASMSGGRSTSPSCSERGEGGASTISPSSALPTDDGMMQQDWRESLPGASGSVEEGRG